MITIYVVFNGLYWYVVSRDGVTVRTEFEGGNSWSFS